MDENELLNFQDNEMSLFQENSMDFAIMSRTYKAAPIIDKERYNASLSESFQGPTITSLPTKNDNSLPTKNAANSIKNERYGSMEILNKKNPKWNYKQQRL